MYPLSIFMVNCDAPLRDELAVVLRRLQASVLKIIPNFQHALHEFRHPYEYPVAVVGCFDTAESLQMIRQFRRLQPTWPIIAVVPAQYLVGAMRAGASQVVATPVQALDFQEALMAIAEQYTVPTRPSQVVTVTGAAGGCGATLIAANLAAEIAQAGNRNVIISEPTVLLGDLALLFDAKPEYSVVDLVRQADLDRTDRYNFDPSLIERALYPVCDRLKLLAGEYRNTPTNPLPPGGVLELVAALRTMADFVVLDVPCTYDDLFFTVLAGAEHVVLVAEQRIPAIRTLQMITEILSQLDGERTVHLLLNRYDPTVLGFTVDKIHEMVPTDTIQTLPTDSAVTATINSGQLLCQAMAKSPVLSGIRTFAQRLTNDTPTAPEKKPALLGRLARIFGIGR